MTPEIDEYPGYYEPYIGLVKTPEIVNELRKSGDDIVALILSISDEKADYRYADGKWSVKEVLMHIIDTERIFAYRALRFSRNDSTELSGFDENTYAEHCDAASRTIPQVAAEFDSVRKASITLIESMNQEMLLRKGKANGNMLTVRAIAHIMAGHALHHCNIIRERYL